jgi:hypothetical protein
MSLTSTQNKPEVFNDVNYSEEVEEVKQPEYLLFIP